MQRVGGMREVICCQENIRILKIHSNDRVNAAPAQTLCSRSHYSPHFGKNNTIKTNRNISSFNQIFLMATSLDTIFKRSSGQNKISVHWKITHTSVRDGRATMEAVNHKKRLDFRLYHMFLNTSPCPKFFFPSLCLSAITPSFRITLWSDAASLLHFGIYCSTRLSQKGRGTPHFFGWADSPINLGVSLTDLHGI